MPRVSRWIAFGLFAALLLGLVGLRLAGGRPAATEGVVAPPAGAATGDPWAEPAEPPRAAIFYDRFETLTVDDGLPSNKITSVLADGDDLWVGTDHGLALRRDGAWNVWSEDDGLGHRYVTSLAVDPLTGDLWAGTLAGLSRLSGGAIRTYTQIDSGLMNDIVYQVAADGDLVWAATAAGTSVFDPRTGSWVLYDHENSIMHEPWCYSIALGPARTWVGIWGGGVAELDRSTGRWRQYNDPDKEMEVDLLRDDGPIHEVTSFVAWDAGLLWQATYFGLSRYDGRRWRTFRKSDTGLPGDFINHVAARGRKAFLGTDEGFGALDGETAVAYKATDDGGCDVTVHRDGELIDSYHLPTGPGDNYVLWTDPHEDEVWIATASGLSRGIARGAS